MRTGTLGAYVSEDGLKRHHLRRWPYTPGSRRGPFRKPVVDRTTASGDSAQPPWAGSQPDGSVRIEFRHWGVTRTDRARRDLAVSRLEAAHGSI